MVVTGLGLLLGGRGDSGLVRAGADRVVVEGVVDLPAGHPALQRAAEAGADVADGLVLVRSVSADGRSRAHVGGRAAPVGVLADLAEHLVAVHGQADQWRLRRADQHREVLDGFGGRDVADALSTYRAVHGELTAAEAELAHLRTAAAERAREADAPARGPGAHRGPRPAARRGHRPGHREPAARPRSRSCGPAPAPPTPPSPATTTPGCRRPGVLEALATASSRLASVSGSDPALAEIGTRVDELRYLAADVAADLGLLPRRRRRRPRPPRAGRAAPGRPRRAHPALRPHRRRRAALGRRGRPAGGRARRHRRPHRRARGARRHPDRRPRARPLPGSRRCAARPRPPSAAASPTS